LLAHGDDKECLSLTQNFLCTYVGYIKFIN
ncbi:hypothetical protein AC249_AIPGENE16711, partial [Exaiptasia diaphana]